ncbi:MAG: cupin domain-containing protein [Dehalococcoidia bacterium]
MEVITITDVAEDSTPRPIFEGKTSVQPLVTKEMAENLGLVMVNFSPGARTKLHIHTHDQVLLVTSGKGILATEEKENVVTPGMLVHVPPGERHWHGATADFSFSHISITSPGETRIVE